MTPFYTGPVCVVVYRIHPYLEVLELRNGGFGRVASAEPLPPIEFENQQFWVMPPYFLCNTTDCSHYLLSYRGKSTINFGNLRL